MGRIGHFDKRTGQHICELCERGFKSSTGLFKHYDNTHEVKLEGHQLFIIDDNMYRFLGKKNTDGFVELLVD